MSNQDHIKEIIIDFGGFSWGWSPAGDYCSDLKLILPDNIINLQYLELLQIQAKMIALPSNLCELPDECYIDFDGNCLPEEYHFDCIDNLGSQTTFCP